MALETKFRWPLKKRTIAIVATLTVAIPAANYMKKTLEGYPTRNMRNVYLRFLAVATKELDSANRKKDAKYLYNELCAALPADAETPSYSEIIAGQLTK